MSVSGGTKLIMRDRADIAEEIVDLLNGFRASVLSDEELLDFALLLVALALVPTIEAARR